MKKTAMAKVVEETASAVATSRASDKFILRLPDGMREHLAEVAERQGRSMNAVVVTALAMYFANEDASPKDQLSGVETVLKDLADQSANQHRELVELMKRADTAILAQLKKGDTGAAREAIESAAQAIKQKIK